MGILDDAIREHLDLKRRQGAAEEELARLEDEAFGPPTRPGDPEFERSLEGEESEGNGAAGEAAAATATEIPAFHDQEAPEGEDVEAPETGEVEAASEAPPTAADEPTFPPAVEAPDAGAEAVRESEEGAGGAEASGGTAAPEDIEALAGEPTVEHDTLGAAGESEDLDLDLDLDLDQEIKDVGDLDLDEDEAAEAGGDAATGMAAPEPASAAEEPVESLDTVEHHFEDALDEAEVVEDDEGELDDLGGDSDEEDVLEETPEFLRDQPEDDELWFEQGEPKDFDF